MQAPSTSTDEANQNSKLPTISQKVFIREKSNNTNANVDLTATNVVVEYSPPLSMFNSGINSKAENRKSMTSNIIIGGLFDDIEPSSSSPLSSSSSSTVSSTYSPPTMVESSTNGALNCIAYKQYSNNRRRNVWNSKSSTSTGSFTTEDFNEHFSRMLDFMFSNIGYGVASYPKLILTIVFVLTAICSLKIPFTPQQDDIKTGYTPIGARSHIETMLYEQFYQNSTMNDRTKMNTALKEINDPIHVVIFVVAKDSGSLLVETHLNETVWLTDELSTKFRLHGKSFYEFCTDFCQFNEPIRQFTSGFILSSRTNSQKNHTISQSGEDESSNDFGLEEDNNNNNNNKIGSTTTDGNRISLSYPFASILGYKFDMSPHFFGVQKFESVEEAEVIGYSRQQLDDFGLNIKFLKLIVLQLRAEKPLGATKTEAMEWERSLTNYLVRDFNLKKSKYVQAYILSTTVVGDEVVRTGMTLFPYISVGFAIMLVFSIATVYMGAFYYDQWTIHKVSLALWGCICPLLATSSALGFLFWFGFRFGTILAVSPFLVMAIGVDDAYLMIHSWQRICAERIRSKRFLHHQRQLAQTKEELKSIDEKSSDVEEDEDESLRKRIAEMLIDVGPSITITSLTNVLAFTIGIFSPTPEIQLFCAGNATAILFDYAYQLFMFTPIIVIAGRYEIKLENSKLNKENEIIERRRKRFGICPPLPEQLTRRQKLESKLTRFMARYCQWLANSFTTILVFFILLIYWFVSLKGALNINVNITPRKLFLSDSFINNINALRDQYILPNYTATSLFINKVGNLNDPIRQKRIRQLVADFESMPNNLGRQFTHFWLRDYDKYIEDWNDEDDVEAKQSKNGVALVNEEQLRSFLNWPEYRHWGGFMRFNNTNFQIEKFFVVIAYHGADLVEWHRRSELLNIQRKIAEEYSDLEAWVWAEDAQFLDQIDTLVPATIQSSVVTLLCMIIVCGLFMTNLFTVVVATLAIVSICIGVFGFLALWSIDLDPISMATTIMSIGFSVDFPAHVTYHYYRGGIDSEMNLRPEERIYQSLIAIGFPLLQCGFSTILFVLCLLFVDTYMSEVFVKTMIMVVSLGLLHGLFIVPTFLCALSNAYELLYSTSKKLQRAVKNLGDGDSPPSLIGIVNSTKPVIKIKRRLSKKNIAKISVVEPTLS